MGYELEEEELNLERIKENNYEKWIEDDIEEIE